MYTAWLAAARCGAAAPHLALCRSRCRLDAVVGTRVKSLLAMIAAGTQRAFLLHFECVFGCRAFVCSQPAMAAELWQGVGVGCPFHMNVSLIDVRPPVLSAARGTTESYSVAFMASNAVHPLAKAHVHKQTSCSCLYIACCVYCASRLGHHLLLVAALAFCIHDQPVGLQPIHA